MKKNTHINGLAAYVILLAIVVVLYFFLYYTPAQLEITNLRAQISLSQAKEAAYRDYISDPSRLQEQIDTIQAQIDDLHANGYVNDSSVSMAISDAVQRFAISLSSVSLRGETSIDGHRALPIDLKITGALDDVISFISHFENHQDGSYMVRAATIGYNGSYASTTVVLYLLTPER